MSKVKVLENHKLIIDEYFSNGFNQTQAVLKFNPDLEYHAAATLGHLVINKKDNKPYIQEKQHYLSLEANVSSAEILKELKAFAFADVTRFIGVDEEEVKKLPSDIRRTLKKITVKEKSFKNAMGEPVTEKTMVYEIHDKLSAIEKISRHIGFYEADNRQKAVTINLAQFDNVTLNNILNVIEAEHDKIS